MTEMKKNEDSATVASFSLLQEIRDDISSRFDKTDEMVSSVRERIAENRASVSSDIQRAAEDERERDMLRFLRRYSSKRAAASPYGKRCNEAAAKTERSLLMLLKRRAYVFYRLEAERDASFYSFSTEKKNNRRQVFLIERELRRQKRSEERELRFERLDSERYCSLLSKEHHRELPSDKKERAAALYGRLEVLLRQREELTERLIALYRGSSNAPDKASIEYREAQIRRKYASSLYRSQKRIAARLASMHVPRDLKDKIFTLMNKKTEYAATIEAARYKIYHTSVKGAARRELVYTVRELRHRINSINAELKYLLKKADDHHEDYREGRNWATLLIILAIAVIVGVAAWYFHGAQIYEYFKNLFGF